MQRAAGRSARGRSPPRRRPRGRRRRRPAGRRRARLGGESQHRVGLRELRACPRAVRSAQAVGDREDAAAPRDRLGGQARRASRRPTSARCACRARIGDPREVARRAGAPRRPDRPGSTQVGRAGELAALGARQREHVGDRGGVEAGRLDAVELRPPTRRRRSARAPPGGRGSPGPAGRARARRSRRRAAPRRRRRRASRAPPGRGRRTRRGSGPPGGIPGRRARR